MVSVAIGDETAEYSGIIKAFDETVNHKNVNATFKLLDNVYLPEKNHFPGRIGFRSSGTSTLDLNGWVHHHPCRHRLNGLEDGITVKGEFAYGEKEFNGIKHTDKARAVSVNRGTLIVNGGSFDAYSGTALEYMRGTVQL